MLETHPASIQDRDGGEPLLLASRRFFPFIQRVFADSGYAGEKVAKATLIAVEIVRKIPTTCRYRECARYQQRCLLCDQPRRASVASSHDIFYPSHNIFYRLGVRRRDDFERAIASRAAPKVTYLPPIPILGPFGGNQLIVALNAICPETRTTFGWYHSHGYSSAVAST